MKILDDLMSILHFDAEVQDIRLGMFHTGVLTRNCGLAASLPKDALKREGPLVAEPGDLLKKTSQELAQLVYSDSLLEAAVGMATINSLLDVDEEKCRDLNAGDLILEKAPGKCVAIVGHFPFIKKLRPIARELWVIEKNPQEGDFEEQTASDLIPKADIVGISGTSITNHTLSDLLGFCRPDAFVVILGASTPLSPILFDYGVDAVSGTSVHDPEMVLRYLSQGANFKQIKGIRKLTMFK